MFYVGDQVIHRVHGAGVITAEKEMRVTETSDIYLVIQMTGSNSTLMIPTDQAELCLRSVSPRAELASLLTDYLPSKPESLPKDYQDRNRFVEGKLKSGEAKMWIEIIRDMAYYKEQKSLSLSDRRLLERAMNLLTEELALARGTELEEAKTHLISIVKDASRNG